MPRQQTGRRTGIVLLFSGIGMAIGGWFAGYVYDSAGSYLPAFALGVAFNLANLGIVGTLISKTKTRHTT
jgi:predicted MFS family arabinose efflux permease